MCETYLGENYCTIFLYIKAGIEEKNPVIITLLCFKWFKSSYTNRFRFSYDFFSLIGLNLQIYQTLKKSTTKVIKYKSAR